MDEARDIEFTNAKATAEKLQDAAHGGAPVAIPGAIEPGQSPPAPQSAVPESTPPIPSTPDDRAEDRLDGGGRI